MKLKEKLSELKVETFRIKLSEIGKNCNVATLEWFSIILLHCAFIPTYLSVWSGISDRLPSLDVALILWTSLLLLFFRSVILKDNLNTITIGVGFVLQIYFLGFIFFR